MPKPINRLKRPHIADLSEVIITRDGDYAVIDYRNPTVGGVNLKLGPDVMRMCDKEILHCHNQVLLARQEAIANDVHEAVEIPVGRPQVKYFELCDQAEYLTFVAASGSGGVEAVYTDESIWLTQKMMGVLYDVETSTINYHLKKVFSDSHHHR